MWKWKEKKIILVVVCVRVALVAVICDDAVIVDVKEGKF